MGGFSIFGGTILNNLYVGANIKFYYYSNNANYSFVNGWAEKRINEKH